MTRVPGMRRSPSVPAARPDSLLTRVLPETSRNCATGWRLSCAKVCDAKMNAASATLTPLLSGQAGRVLMMSSFARTWYFAPPRGSTARSWRARRGEIVEPRGACEIRGAFPRARGLELQDLAAARRGHGDLECEAPPFARSGEAFRARDDRPRHAIVHATHGPLHAAAHAHA